MTSGQIVAKICFHFGMCHAFHCNKHIVVLFEKRRFKYGVVTS